MRVAPKDLGSRVRVLELESQKRKTGGTKVIKMLFFLLAPLLT